MISYSSPIRPAIDSTVIFFRLYSELPMQMARKNIRQCRASGTSYCLSPGLEINKQSSLFLPKLRFLFWTFGSFSMKANSQNCNSFSIFDSWCDKRVLTLFGTMSLVYEFRRVWFSSAKQRIETRPSDRSHPTLTPYPTTWKYNFTCEYNWIVFRVLIKMPNSYSLSLSVCIFYTEM